MCAIHAVLHMCQTRSGALTNSPWWCSIGRADVSARIMAMMLDQGHHAAVLDTLVGATPLESSKAVSQVLLRLADQQRYNVLANVCARLKPISGFSACSGLLSSIQALRSYQGLLCLANLTSKGATCLYERLCTPCDSGQILAGLSSRRLSLR